MSPASVVRARYSDGRVEVLVTSAGCRRLAEMHEADGDYLNGARLRLLAALKVARGVRGLRERGALPYPGESDAQRLARIRAHRARWA